VFNVHTFHLKDDSAVCPSPWLHRPRPARVYWAACVKYKHVLNAHGVSRKGIMTGLVENEIGLDEDFNFLFFVL